MEKQWHFKKLFIPPLIVFILYLSWLSPFFRPLWDQIDRGTFHFLNQLIQTNRFWQNFWAFMGHRIMDYIHDGIMFLFFFVSIKKAHEALRSRKIAEFFFTIFVIALTIYLVNGTFFPDFLHVYRKSPSLVDESAFRLSSAVKWIKVKDHSYKCFPGDHASTAILFTSFIYYLMGWRIGIIATFYAILFCLPRLIVGAHWLTDILLGSALVALTISSLFMGSPLGQLLINFFEKIMKRIHKRVYAK